jgi:hypothetical protein
MKKILFSFFIIFTYSNGYAQFYKSVLPSPDFSNALEKIVLDFRLDYHTIQVDSLVSHEDGYEIYGSSVTLPGSTDCQIMRFHSVDDTTAAFQATFYQGEDYNEAVKAYQNCIRIIKRSRIHWIDRRIINFGGKEESSSESVPFTVSVLRITDLDDYRYKNFCAEVEIRGDVTGWQVHASFHYKRSDTEGPTE